MFITTGTLIQKDPSCKERVGIQLDQTLQITVSGELSLAASLCTNCGVNNHKRAHGGMH